MDEEHRRALAALHQELDHTEPANDAVKAQIDTLKRDIHTVIAPSEQSAADTENLHGLRQRLENSIDDFEVHHPSLAEAVRVAVNTLVNAGT